jgi:CyaY protein
MRKTALEDTMTETEFNDLADSVIGFIEEQIEASGASVETELKGTGMLELEFDNGSKIIINRQTPMQEIWVAAKSGGFHYRLVDAAWRNTRDGSELFAALSALISQQAGEPVSLSAPT